MHKLTVFYTQPADVDAFETAYANHLALVEKVPGIAGTRLTRGLTTLRGDGYYLVAEMLFADQETLDAAMNSPEMAAVGKDARQFADNLSGMMLATE